MSLRGARGGRARAAAVVLPAVAAALAGFILLVRPECPASGFLLTPAAREAARLKNREARPRPEDFDERVSLTSLTRPGDDRGRWSAARAGAVEGYVVGVERAGAEAANCFSPSARDTHILVAARPDAPARETVIVEVTPRLERRAAQQGSDWSADALRRELLGRRCRFEGWLFFDAGHADRAENTAPGAAGNWRATAWELHPVTDFQVLR